MENTSQGLGPAEIGYQGGIGPPTVDQVFLMRREPFEAHPLIVVRPAGPDVTPGGHSGGMQDWMAGRVWHRRARQRLLNTAVIPSDWVDALIPIDVIARVVWAEDGEEHVHGRALAWTSGEVFVEIRDPRWQLDSVWLAARDVQRR